MAKVHLTTGETMECVEDQETLVFNYTHNNLPTMAVKWDTALVIEDGVKVRTDNDIKTVVLIKDKIVRFEP